LTESAVTSKNVDKCAFHSRLRHQRVEEVHPIFSTEFERVERRQFA